jgi:serine/threonine protein kinase
MGKIYALKQVRKAEFRNEEFVANKNVCKYELFGKEIFFGFRQIPYIINVFDSYKVNDYVYILMEYANSGTLKSFIEKRKVTLVDALHMLFQISLNIFIIHFYFLF